LTVEEPLLPVHVGCSGWNYQSWRGEMYPPGLSAGHWLERYAELFDTVEVNTTFYRLVERETVERWVRQTPADFMFAVKASRYLTHIKRLSDIQDGVARFFERIEPLIEAERLGPVLWQLPETFHRDEGRLADTLAQLPAGRHAFEFRHPSWFVPNVYELLREHDAALVIADHPDRPFQTCELTTSWCYVRFHHGRQGRRGNYSDRELKGWARLLHGWRERSEALVYFNNDWEVFAPKNALKLHQQLERINAAKHNGQLLRSRTGR
jgi:uncharacterized protein YecE (DUF72 family)